MNVDDTINRIQFFGPSFDYLTCLTGTERFSIWSTDVQNKKKNCGKNIS